MSRGAQRLTLSGWQTYREVMHRADIWLTAGDELPTKAEAIQAVDSGERVRGSQLRNFSDRRVIGRAEGPRSAGGGLAESSVLPSIQEVLRPYFGARSP